MSINIDENHIRHFRENGFVVLKGFVSEALVKALQTASACTIDRALSDYHAGIISSQIAYSSNANPPSVFRINQLLHSDPVFSQALLQPDLLNGLKAVIGEPIVPMYESLLIKEAGQNSEIGWHWDMKREQSDVIITVGIYLDHSDASQDALCVIPGSHKMPGDICYFEDELAAGRLKAIEVEAEPGDVIIHDVMLAHSSKARTMAGQRKTIYFEFRSLSHVKHNPRFNQAWIGKRTELLEHASNNTVPSDDFISELYALSVNLEAGHYCFRFEQA